MVNYEANEKMLVFSRVLEGDYVIVRGKLFHNLGPTTEKARLPLFFKLGAWNREE